MEVLSLINPWWVWAIAAFIIMPFLGVRFYEADRLSELDRQSLPGVICWAAVCALLWPVILGIGLVLLVTVSPTLYFIGKRKDRLDREELEARREREVLTQLEAEKKAEDEKLKWQFAEAGITEPEPPHKNPQGQMRKSQNEQFYIEFGWPDRLTKRYRK